MSEKIAALRDIIMPLSMGLSATALSAVTAFMWNMNATMATVVLTQEHQAMIVATLSTRVEELRDTTLKTQLEVTRVESQCLMWAEALRGKR